MSVPEFNMIPINEFLTLSATALDIKILREWQHAPDASFVAYVLEHHREFDYQHLRGALRILQNVDSQDVRELFKYYAKHSEPGFRALAIGSLNEQQKRGWCKEPAGVH